MKRLNALAFVLCAACIGGCRTPPPSPPERNWSHAATLMVTNLAITGQFEVQARVYEVGSDEPIPESRPDFTRKGHLDLLSAPKLTVESDKWAEIRVCDATNDLYSVEALMGEEVIHLSQSPGIVMRIKVNPVAGGKVRCVGVLSLGSEITVDYPGYLRVFPFDVTIPLGKEITLLRKGCNQDGQNTALPAKPTP